MSSYTTIRDLAADINEVLGLDDVAAVEQAIRTHRSLFDRYETITPDQSLALIYAVWDEVTDHAPYPWE